MPLTLTVELRRKLLAKNLLSVRPHKSIHTILRCRLTPTADSLKVSENATTLVHRFFAIDIIILLTLHFVNKKFFKFRFRKQRSELLIDKSLQFLQDTSESGLHRQYLLFRHCLDCRFCLHHQCLLLHIH